MSIKILTKTNDNNRLTYENNTNLNLDQPSQFTNKKELINETRSTFQGTVKQDETNKTSKIYEEYVTTLDQNNYQNKDVIKKIKQFYEEKGVDFNTIYPEGFVIRIENLGENFYSITISQGDPKSDSAPKQLRYQFNMSTPSSRITSTSNNNYPKDTSSPAKSESVIHKDIKPQEQKQNNTTINSIKDLSLKELMTILSVPVEIVDKTTPREYKRSQKSLSELINNHFGRNNSNAININPKTPEELLEIFSKIDTYPDTSSGRILSQRIKRLKDTFDPNGNSIESYRKISEQLKRLDLTPKGLDNSSELKLAYVLANEDLSLDLILLASNISVEREAVIQTLNNPETSEIARKFKEHWLKDRESDILKLLPDVSQFLAYASSEEEKPLLESETAGTLSREVAKLYKDKLLKSPGEYDTLIFFVGCFFQDDDSLRSIDTNENYKKEFLNNSYKILTTLKTINDVIDFLPENGTQLWQFISLFNQKELESGLINEKTLAILKAFKNNGYPFKIGEQKNHANGPVSKIGEVAYILNKISEFSKAVPNPVEALNSLNKLSPEFFKQADWEFLLDTITEHQKNYPHELKKDPFAKFTKDGLGTFLTQITKDFPNDMTALRFGFDQNGDLLTDGETMFFKNKIIKPQRFQSYIHCFEARGKDYLKEYREIAPKEVKAIDDVILDTPALIVNSLKSIKFKFPQIQIDDVQNIFKLSYALTSDKYRTDKDTDLGNFMSLINSLLNESTATDIHNQVVKLGKNATMNFSSFTLKVANLENNQDEELAVAIRDTPDLLDKGLFATGECLDNNNLKNTKYAVDNLLSETKDIINKRELLSDTTFKEYFSRYVKSDPDKNLTTSLLSLMNNLTIDNIRDFETAFKKLEDFKISDNAIFQLLTNSKSFVKQDLNYDALKKLLDDQFPERDSDEISESIMDLYEALFRKQP